MRNTEAQSVADPEKPAYDLPFTNVYHVFKNQKYFSEGQRDGMIARSGSAAALTYVWVGCHGVVGVKDDVDGD